MPTDITTALIGIIASLLGGWTGAAISRKSATDILKKQQFFAAASKFKVSVIYELTGFFPINQHWDKKDFHRLYDSVPRINSACAEFRYFVASKTDFDKAVGEYNNYCRNETYIDPGLEAMYQSTTKTKTHAEQKKEFMDIVEHLITFANYK